MQSLEELEQYSNIALYSAMAVYSIAFVFYAVDLANRSGDAGAGTTPGAATGQAGRSRSLRIGFSLTVLGFLLHLGATVLRGIAAERVPFANMYEFSLTATVAIIAIFLLAQFFVDLRYLGALVTGMTVLFLGIARVNFYREIVPLPPVTA